MTEIILETIVQAPLERVFDLARSIDFHCHSTADTQEKAIAGVTHGLIGLNEEVTWRARHFLVWQKLTVWITEYESPTFFQDEMVAGAFRWIRHDHFFSKTAGDGTLMRDVFTYAPPLGVAGRMADELVLKRCFRRFLLARNDKLKTAAETDIWKKLLPQST